MQVVLVGYFDDGATRGGWRNGAVEEAINWHMAQIEDVGGTIEDFQMNTVGGGRMYYHTRVSVPSAEIRAAVRALPPIPINLKVPSDEPKRRMFER